MRRILLAAIVLATAAQAQAQARPDTRQLTCSAVNQLVVHSGSIVMTTGPSRFQRFVRDVGFCDRYESLRLYEVPTRDSDSCAVHSICFDFKRTGSNRG